MAKVLVPIAPGCEELEAITIVDLLRRAEIEVITASLDQGTDISMVIASRGVRLVPDTTLDEALKQKDSFDMLALPGGLPGSDHLNDDPRIQSLLKEMQSQDKFTAAICAAPKVLANTQLLKGKTATSYPGVIDQMELNETTLSEANVVVDGKVVTSRGPATAMEFALNLIEVLVGKDKRNEVAQGLLWQGA